MKICYSPESIIDLNGMPLVGRVVFKVHDSDTLLDIYTLEENDIYVQSANPLLLDDAGRLEKTVFFDVQIADVVVQKFVGEPGTMDYDSPDSDFEDFDRFEIGFDFDPSENITDVDTVEDLADANVALRIVRVNGYYASGDCASRIYKWCSNVLASNADGGYYIASNVQGTGCWVLLWDGSEIPAMWYGVKPGTETNLGALLSYPNTITVSAGVSIKTSGVVRFHAGTYTRAGSFSTSKVLAFDNNAQFAGALTFTCSGVSIEGNSNYVCDFVFSGRSVTAHSSWFRTAMGFFGCGAKQLVIDSTNFFSDSDISSVKTVQNAVVSGMVAPTISFTTGFYIIFDNCEFVGTPLSASHFYLFKNCKFSDKFFENASAIDFDFGTAGSHGIQANLSGAGANIANVNDFRDPNVYVRLAKEQLLPTIDLCGRTCSGFRTSANVLRNIVCTGTIEVISDVRLDNVHASVLPNDNNISAVGSAIEFAAADNPAKSISVLGGMVSGLIDAQNLVYICDCTFTSTASISPSTDAQVTLERVTVYPKTSSETFGGKHLRLKDCTIHRTVDIRPYKSSTYYYFDVIIDGNLFLDDGWLNFNANNDPAIYEITTNWFTITNNTFDGNGDIAMPYIAADGAHKFLGAVSGFVYGGNKGSTIREKGPETFNSSTMTRTHTFGAKDYNITADTWRVFNLNNNDVFQSYRDNGDYGYRLGGYADGVFGENAKTYAETLVHNKAISNVYNDQFLVAEAWADQDGYVSGKYVFFGD